MEVFSKPYFVLFVIMALGILLGNIKIKGISFGLSAAIFAGMLFGNFANYYDIEFEFPHIIQDLGLIFFIYTIGMQAGPSFVNSLKSDGKNFIFLSLVILLSGALVVFILQLLIGLDKDILLGLLTGAFTSTPGLAAAIESSSSPNASIAYGIAYPFGVIGVILFINLLPKLFGQSVKSAEKEYQLKQNKEAPKIYSKNYAVENSGVVGKKLEDLHIATMTGASIPRILRADGTKELATSETELNKGDVVRAVGTEEELSKFETLIGPATEVEIPRSGEHVIQWYVVTNTKIINSTIGELNLSETFVATPTRIRRAGLEFSVNSNMKLRYGDRILISSTKGNAVNLEKLFGNSVKRLSAINFLPIGLGIVIGVLVGTISFPLFGINISLGLTGGVLLTAVITSNLGKTGPIIWYLPASANTLLRELGLLFFLIPVGYKAGQDLTNALDSYGAELFLYGILITIVPLAVGAFVGLRVLKMNLLNLMGAISGGMTSTPGLSAADNLTDSDAPQVTYVAVYPFALVLMVLVVKIISALL